MLWPPLLTSWSTRALRLSATTFSPAAPKLVSLDSFSRLRTKWFTPAPPRVAHRLHCNGSPAPRQASNDFRCTPGKAASAHLSKQRSSGRRSLVSAPAIYRSFRPARAIATAQHGIEPKDDLRQPRITGLPQSRLIYGCPSAHGGQNRRQEVFANFTT